MAQSDMMRQVLELYKLDIPLPREARKDLVSSAGDTLKAVLKKQGKYGFFISLVISLIFRVNRYGLSLSFAKASYALGTAAAITVASVGLGVAAGTAPGADQIVRQKQIQKQIPKKEIIKKESPSKAAALIRVSPVKFENTISVQSFDDTSVNTGAGPGSRPGEQVKKELVRLRGRGNIVSSGAQKADIVLFGALDWSGDTYMLSVTAAGSKTGRVVFVTLEKAKNAEELKSACRKIAREVSAAVK
ncbi:MAG: hypothetical protein GY754_18970 [bacterium]|nr:hypothetical protein [bacterium]